MLIPWRNLERWECLQCGLCCKKFYVSLTRKEKRILSWRYGNQVVSQHGGEWHLKKQNGTCILQDSNGLCTIHKQKPNNCDMFPFYVFKEPRHHLSGNKAEYWMNSTCFYIYVHDFCNGLGEGSPIRDRLPKILRLWAQKGTSRGMVADDTSM